MTDPVRGLGGLGLSIDDDALAAIASYANGDARIALNLLDMASASVGSDPRITAALVADLAQNRALLYDKTGEEHYNLISALHKSMRNSDPDASVYWLARMLEAGEDPLFVARRLVRFASEDIGNADPQALGIAVAAKDAVHFVGMPEGNTALAQAAIYLATAPKSNAVYVAYMEAAEAAAKEVAEPVPLHLRNAPTGLMKQLDYGKGYRYAHDEPDGVADMECLPPAHRGRSSIGRRIAAGRAAKPERDAGARQFRCFTFRNISAPKRKDEREPVISLHPADRESPPALPSRLSTPPPETPGCPSVRHVTSLLGVRWPT